MDYFVILFLPFFGESSITLCIHFYFRLFWVSWTFSIFEAGAFLFGVFWSFLIEAFYELFIRSFLWAFYWIFCKLWYWNFLELFIEAFRNALEIESRNEVENEICVKCCLETSGIWNMFHFQFLHKMSFFNPINKTQLFSWLFSQYFKPPEPAPKLFEFPDQIKINCQTL